MPKGRMGVFGSGPFYRVRLPPPGEKPKTEEQRKLVALDEIKSEVMGELAERAGYHFTEKEQHSTWCAIIDAVGAYLGQLKNGLPPTQSERDKMLTRITKAAELLENELDVSNFHVTDLLHKVMRRRNADLFKLKKHLSAITDPMPMDEEVSQPKARPDPKEEPLIRELVQIWLSVTGKVPGKDWPRSLRGWKD